MDLVRQMKMEMNMGAGAPPVADEPISSDVTQRTRDGLI
jgi:hypothetical protein